MCVCVCMVCVLFYFALHTVCNMYLLCITHCIHMSIHTAHMKVCSYECMHNADNMYTQLHEYMSML